MSIEHVAPLPSGRRREQITLIRRSLLIAILILVNALTACGGGPDTEGALSIEEVEFRVGRSPGPPPDESTGWETHALPMIKSREALGKELEGW